MQQHLSKDAFLTKIKPFKELILQPKNIKSKRDFTKFIREISYIKSSFKKTIYFFSSLFLDSLFLFF